MISNDENNEKMEIFIQKIKLHKLAIRCPKCEKLNTVNHKYMIYKCNCGFEFLFNNKNNNISK